MNQKGSTEPVSIPEFSINGQAKNDLHIDLTVSEFV